MTTEDTIRALLTQVLDATTLFSEVDLFFALKFIASSPLIEPRYHVVSSGEIVRSLDDANECDFFLVPPLIVQPPRSAMRSQSELVCASHSCFS